MRGRWRRRQLCGTGGGGAALGGMLGAIGSLVAGSLKSNEASTMLL
jgi:hypothetical protein